LKSQVQGFGTRGWDRCVYPDQLFGIRVSGFRDSGFGFSGFGIRDSGFGFSGFGIRIFGVRDSGLTDRRGWTCGCTRTLRGTPRPSPRRHAGYEARSEGDEGRARSLLALGSWPWKLGLGSWLRRDHRDLLLGAAPRRHATTRAPDLGLGV